MRSIAIHLFILMIVSGCAVASEKAVVCGDSGSAAEGDRSVHRARIFLKPYTGSHSYYLLVNEKRPSFHYAILVTPQDVIEDLKKRISLNGHRMYSVLLAEIEKDLPLRQNVDINKYGISDPRFVGYFDSIFANLVGQGKASILDLWELDEATRSVNEVLLTSIESPGGKYRAICNLQEESILFVTDVIAN